MKSERGNADVGLMLLLGVVVFVIFGIFGVALMNGIDGMQAGAETIGNAAGDAIDNAVRDQDFENLVWEAQNAVSFWVNQQKLTPNAHSIARHGDDAWAATNCYNNNGTFQIWRVGPFEFHLLCRDTDGSIFDLIFTRRGEGSNEFELMTAFRKEKGLRDAIDWLIRKRATNKVTMPNDTIFFVDGMVP